MSDQKETGPFIVRLLKVDVSDIPKQTLWEQPKPQPGKGNITKWLDDSSATVITTWTTGGEEFRIRDTVRIQCHYMVFDGNDGNGAGQAKLPGKRAELSGDLKAIFGETNHSADGVVGGDSVEDCIRLALPLGTQAVWVRGRVYPTSVMESFAEPIRNEPIPLPDGIYRAHIAEIGKGKNVWTVEKSPTPSIRRTIDCTILDGIYAYTDFCFESDTYIETKRSGVEIRNKAFHRTLTESEIQIARGVAPGHEPWNAEIKPPPILSIKDHFEDWESVMADPPKALHLVENLINAKELIILGGPIKSRKTSMAIDLAVAAVSGGEWITGKIERPLRVMMIDAEMEPAEILRRVKWSCDRRKLEMVEVLKSLQIIPLKGRPGIITVEHLFQEAYDLAIFRPDLIIADNLKSLLPTTQGMNDDNSPIAMRIVMRMWRSFLDVFGECGLLLLAHHPKGSDATIRDALEMISGSFVTGAAADGGVAIAQKDPGKRNIQRDKWPWFMQSQMRNRKQFRFRVRPSECERWWVKSGGAETEDREKNPVSATDVTLNHGDNPGTTVDAVKEIFVQSGKERLSRNLIAKRLGMRKATALATIQDLIHSGDLKEDEDGIGLPD